MMTGTQVLDELKHGFIVYSINVVLFGTEATFIKRLLMLVLWLLGYMLMAFVLHLAANRAIKGKKNAS
jgi:hypothetical protein